MPSVTLTCPVRCHCQHQRHQMLFPACQEKPWELQLWTSVMMMCCPVNWLLRKTPQWKQARHTASTPREVFAVLNDLHGTSHQAARLCPRDSLSPRSMSECIAPIRILCE